MDSLRSGPFFGLLLATAVCGCSHSVGTATFQEVDSSVRRVEIRPEASVEARGKKVMVATEGRAATQAALRILHAGGNLLDAAIAASLTISVERPQSTGLGGGGFLIYHEAKTGKNYVYDFRERAPAASKRDQFLDEQGNAVAEKSLVGGLAVGVPGLVRGLKQVHSRHGKLKWQKLFAPAIELARSGVELYPDLQQSIEGNAKYLSRSPETAKIFLTGAKKLQQPELAETLKRLSKDPEDFYRGRIASRIVSAVQKAGGNLNLDDLRHYQVRERTAVEADWMGFHLISMPPPSSGGIHVIQILKFLELEALRPQDFQTVPALHHIAQAMQQAFADRAKYLGDPDFVKVPVQGLISGDYIRLQHGRFIPDRARHQTEVVPGAVSYSESNDTTHLSLMDAEGNVVVSTQSVNGKFGAKFVAEDTGIVMNNTMDDFSAKPGAQNLFGAVGGEANEVQPGKTPLSSMSPTIVLKDGKPVLAVGAPGGTRIISAVAQVILNLTVFKKPLYEAVAAPRIHHQWIPDELTVENQPVSVTTLEGLDRMGYTVKRVPTQTRIMAVSFDGKELVGVSDPRDIGTSAGE